MYLLLWQGQSGNAHFLSGGSGGADSGVRIWGISTQGLDLSLFGNDANLLFSSDLTIL